MKRLLLHICCAPDQTVAVERTVGDYEVTGFFSNSCIEPDGEYRRRLDNAKYLAEVQGIPIIEDDYFPEAFIDLSKGLEKEPERGRRCDKCIVYRLRRTAERAKADGFDCFATTLTVSPHKDTAFINKTGEELAWELDIEYLPTDFKKQAGFQRSVELSKKLGIYRQNYCGCRYSLRDKKKREADRLAAELEQAVPPEELPSLEKGKIHPNYVPPGAFFKPEDIVNRRFKQGPKGRK